MNLSYIVKESDVSIRQILKNEFDMSDRFILKLKNGKSIFINDKNVSIGFQISFGDILEIRENFVEDSSNIVANSQIKLDILYEDEFLLILNKPAGLPVHPSILHFEDSLSNGVKFYFDKIGLKKKIRPVNRLDRDTSGIVIFAKNEYIQESLIKQMKNGNFKKKYVAILDGILDKKNGTIDAPISRKENSIIERCINDDGSPSITHYTVLDEFNNFSLVEFILETGRTHQIRVHSKYIGHPILGDSLYGTESNIISRQALHAYFVSFIHPIFKKEVCLKIDISEDMVNVLKTK